MKQVLKEFMDLGFTQEEVFKIFEVRKKVQAFKKTDIHNRFKSLCLFFKKFRQDKEETNRKIEEICFKSEKNKELYTQLANILRKNRNTAS